jgi:hypothetical protein
MALVLIPHPLLLGRFGPGVRGASSGRPVIERCAEVFITVFGVGERGKGMVQSVIARVCTNCSIVPAWQLGRRYQATDKPE